MKRILVVLLFLQTGVANGQTVLSGNITPSDNFQNKLYILKHNHFDPHSPVVFDSIQISSDGSFTYRFTRTSPQDLIYKLLLPSKTGYPFAAIGTAQKNFVYITTAGSENIALSGKGDSLFYSSVISGGRNNVAIHQFTALQKPFFLMERVLMDSVVRNPSKLNEYKQQLMPVWMVTVESLKPRVLAMLDTSKTAPVILLGLQTLFETNFGRLDSAVATKYLRKVANPDLLLVRNIEKLIAETPTRVGRFIPDITVTPPSGKQVSLFSIKSEYILIDFWASWCGPCRYANKYELPALAKEYKGKVELVSLSIDESVKKWKDAIKKDGISWKQFIDKDLVLKKALDIQSVPVYILLDSDHKIVFESNSVYQIEKHINSLLGQ